jgi:phosphoribosyl 1,2-cyclic phosphodiesterase
MIRTTFWGVRGSIPTPGPQTAQIGGNTSCVEVLCGKTRVVFDAGTGLRLLGSRLLGEMPLTLHLFFSHVHWDHIQGFPFFGPAFVPGNTLHMYGAPNSRGTIESAMAGQMEFPNFPVKLNQLGSHLVFHDIDSGDVIELEGGVVVRCAPGTHPGGVLAYRVDHDGGSVVYATDTEHHPSRIDQRLVDLAKGADLFIYDSMYTPEEYDGRHDGRSRVGWGHSTFVEGARVAEAAGVGRYVLFHHDPDQDDHAVREKERRARELFPRSDAAYEGLTIDVG